MKKLLLIFLIIITAILIASPVLADGYQLKNPLAGVIGSSFEEDSIPKLIGTILKGFLGIIGAVAVILFIYGGYTLLISHGNTNKVNEGKKILIWTTIGIVLVLTSYVLLDLVIYALTGESQSLTEQPYDPPAPLPTPEEVSPQCSDGADNDGDGYIDFGSDRTKNDPGCESAEDDNERGEKCYEISQKTPNYCTQAGLQCIPCNVPNAEGENFSCRDKAALEAQTNMGATQATCHSCAGSFIGCAKGEACCCIDCAVDKIQNLNCSQILQAISPGTYMTCP